jgi:hypothetical protein
MSRGTMSNWLSHGMIQGQEPGRERLVANVYGESSRRGPCEANKEAD